MFQTKKEKEYKCKFLSHVWVKCIFKYDKDKRCDVIYNKMVDCAKKLN